jgi:predicted ATPase/transcriptional regulator with XRE-family HTH domain
LLSGKICRHGGGRDRSTSFGALLKRYRLAAGLSQESLADRARLSARAISSYERGLRQAPYQDSLRQLIHALKLSADDELAFEAAVQRRRGPKVGSTSADTSSVHRSNLRAPMTSFVGRKREIAEVKRVLEGQARLLTLVGTGGSGKTRLALQVAGDLVAAYPDGIWLVDLAPVADPSLVIHAVAAATGVRDEPGQPLLNTLCAALRSRRLLLVLDNCEHHHEACAQLGETLLRECPKLRILATSRQALGIAAETSRQVPSLALPDPEDATISVRSSEAVQLFVKRAQNAHSSFALSGQNATTVAQLCRQLDGIPLAIELAAARLRVLSVEQIAQRLDNHRQLLTGGSSDALPRHQTLRAMLDWSYALLTDPEQAVFRRLAVFAGSFDLDAVEAIAGGAAPGSEGWGWSALHAVQHPTPDAPSVLDLLTALVGKSMLQVEEVAAEARYRLLETLRQYGNEKLFTSGDADTARRRHRKWYRSLAERAEPELTGPHQHFWLNRVEREYDNIRAVIVGTTADRGELVEGLGLAAKLLRLWIIRGYIGEGRRLLDPLLLASEAHPDLRRTSAWREAMHTAALAAYFQGDLERTRCLADQWLAAARELREEREIWFANDMLARVFMKQGDYQQARAIFVDQLAAMRRLDYSFGIASALIGLGVVARLQGDFTRAVAFSDDCLTLSRTTGDFWFIGQALTNLGLAYYRLGQYGVARKQFVEALALHRELGDRSGMAWSLINLGDVSHAQGDLSGARALFEESLAILRDLGDRSGRTDALAALGRVAQAQGDFASARLCFVESLTLQRDLGQRVAMPQLLEDLAGLAAAQGRHVRALTLVDAAGPLRDGLGSPRTSEEEDRIEAWSGPIRHALGGKATVAPTEAKAMTLDQAIAYALADDEAATDETQMGVE